MGLQDRFEKWAFLVGFDIARSGVVYENQKTRTAFIAYEAATRECVNLCAEVVVYYVEGSPAAKAAGRCLDAICQDGAGG